MQLKLAAIECFRSESLLSTVPHSDFQGSFLFVRTSFFKYSDTILAAFQQPLYTTAIFIEFSFSDSPHALNGFPLQQGIRSMLDLEDCPGSDVLSSSMGTFLDCYCFRVSLVFTFIVFTMYSYILFSAILYHLFFKWTEQRFFTLQNQIYYSTQSPLSVLGA